MKKKNVLLLNDAGELEIGILSFSSQEDCHVELWSEGFYSGDVSGDNYCDCLHDIQKLLSAQYKKLLCYGCREDFRLSEEPEAECAEIGYLVRKSPGAVKKHFVFDYTSASAKIRILSE